MSRLSGRKILLGLSGGIAAYKAPDLVRALQKRGAQVRCVLTPNARRFVAPLTLSTLTGRPAIEDTFDSPAPAEGGPPIEHTQAAEWADAFLIAPATADLIARMAAGMADDALTTHLIAFDGPVLICPAMNTKMLNHPLTRFNVQTLQDVGYRFLPPDEGELACGVYGAGRLPDPSAILEGLERLFAPQDLAGKKAVVTAGPTREPLDPMRYLSNRSSGKMGYALAREAARRGAEVVLIAGPTALDGPPGLRVVPVETALEMREAVRREAADAQLVVKSAAVADFRPATPSARKLKKAEMAARIELTPNPDILMELGRQNRPGRLLIGFAAESTRDRGEAQRKLAAKHLDMIVLNEIGQAVGGEENQAVLLDRRGNEIELPRMTKDELAVEIFNAAAALMAVEAPKRRTPSRRSGEHRRG